MKIKRFITFLIIISPFFCLSQEYFIIANDTLNEQEIDKLLEDHKTHYAAQKKSKFKFVSFRIKKKKIFGSRVYNTISIIVSNKEDDNREIKFNRLLNKPLPDFLLRNIDGKLTSSLFLNDKPTLINLWFINCPPCIKEIPELNRIRNAFGNNVNFVAITFNDERSTKEFLKSTKYNFRQFIEAGKYIRESLGVFSYPKIILLDKKGIVRYLSGGIPKIKGEKKKLRYNSSELKRELQLLIKE